MCVTAEFSTLDKTYIGAWDINHPRYGYRHVLAYQNRVKNTFSGPNCMLLHIPSAQPIQPEWLVDTTEHSTFLTDMYYFLAPRLLGRGLMSHDESSGNYVVEQGVYHIAILNNLNQEALDTTLEKIPKEKLPSIDFKLIEFFKQTFPNFPLLLCCFNNKVAKQASPILVHFPPKFPNTLMLNTLDSHGGIPDLKHFLPFHQKLILGSSKEVISPPPPYHLLHTFSNHPLKEFFPNYAIGIDFYKGNAFQNRDVCIDLNKLHSTIPFDVEFRHITTPTPIFSIQPVIKQSNHSLTVQIQPSSTSFSYGSSSISISTAPPEILPDD